MAVKGKRITAVPATTSQAGAQAPLVLPRFSAALRLLIYPCCLLVPGGGFALGMVYFGQEDREARSFGKICLVLALLGLLAHWGGQSEFKSFQTGETLVQPYY